MTRLDERSGSQSAQNTLLFSTASLTLSPSGHLYIHSDPENKGNISEETLHKIQKIFGKKRDIQISATNLLRFGITDFSSALPSSFLFWHRFIQLFIQKAQEIIGLESKAVDPNISLEPSLNDLQALMDEAPFMQGAEYLSLDTLWGLWKEQIKALREELEAFEGTLQGYLARYNPSWKKVGRVCFHLAENKSNFETPFAFMGTYTKQLSGKSTLQHLPLGQALKEYAGNEKKQQLLSLLIPVRKASEKSSFIKDLVDSGDIFRLLAWESQKAYVFLKSIPLIEEAGIIVRVPNWWKPQKPPRPQVTISIGNSEAKPVGMEAILDFGMSYTLPDGSTLSSEEMEKLLKSQEELVHIKGQWVEVNQEKISQVLTHWQKVERQVREGGLTFAEGLRLLSSVSGKDPEELPQEDISDWSQMIEGNWIKNVLSRLRNPDQQENDSFHLKLKEKLKGTLRPYQFVGVKWLWWLYTLRLGGCLADDMGLGKTIQVLSLFLLSNKNKNKKPHLLILPASLLGNWQAEIKKFAPSLNVWIAHRSDKDHKNLQKDQAPDLSAIDIVITTYSNVYRLSWINKMAWDIVILDEAQNIKNPSTKQTLAIKKLKSQVRFIMTGTPIENKLLDLWSLFDFLAPGLLGSSQAFSEYGTKALKETSEEGGKEKFYAAVRHLITPYILRRLKSDKSIISDLPDKTEIDTYCLLTKQQISLYQKSLEKLKESLELAENGDEMKRRGLVLSYLTLFKQICNHPDQWAGHGDYKVEESGKFLRLKELCEVIYEKQEKVLVFTQYKEIIPALYAVLEKVFKKPGLVLHGQTPVKERPKLVESFQQEQGPPFFILSIKAGGTGLTLTKASHVIHFDRWWNPAIENQATDRAYRIGQKKNVLVHKFICQGTIEEKIDSLIQSKKELSSTILSKNVKPALTEMNNEELLKAVSLDIHRAIGESVTD